MIVYIILDDAPDGMSIVEVCKTKIIARKRLALHRKRNSYVSQYFDIMRMKVIK